jgi:hypothetical protein
MGSMAPHQLAKAQAGPIIIFNPAVIFKLNWIKA